MSDKPLTAAQSYVMKHLADGWTLWRDRPGKWRMTKHQKPEWRVDANTGRSLVRRELVVDKASPFATVKFFVLTDAGRAALSPDSR
jgi:hypothetical protein